MHKLFKKLPVYVSALIFGAAFGGAFALVMNALEKLNGAQPSFIGKDFWSTILSMSVSAFIVKILILDRQKIK